MNKKLKDLSARLEKGDLDNEVLDIYRTLNDLKTNLTNILAKISYILY